MAIDPLTAMAILQGVNTGAGLIKGRQQKSAGESQQALQNVLQSLSPQTQGQRPISDAGGRAGAVQGVASDPLVKDLITKLLGGKNQQSNKRAALPDPSQGLAMRKALSGGGSGGGGGGSTNAAPPPLGTDLAGAGETAWAWPGGRRVTMEELRGGFNPAWKRVHPLPSGPGGGTQSFQQGGLLDDILGKLRG